MVLAGPIIALPLYLYNEIEDAKAEHLEAGANVLLHSMLAFAGQHQ